ncbi:hypothetical protein R1flu_029001 [Riccia fluitans]|uniref:Uncharacterized protein n=1 Tax=Riccia fluitans TaxID=41844 RepID=A0ABD1XNY4_9MARC
MRASDGSCCSCCGGVEGNFLNPPFNSWHAGRFRLRDKDIRSFIALKLGALGIGPPFWGDVATDDRQAGFHLRLIARLSVRRSRNIRKELVVA